MGYMIHVRLENILYLSTQLIEMIILQIFINIFHDWNPLTGRTFFISRCI